MNAVSRALLASGLALMMFGSAAPAEEVSTEGMKEFVQQYSDTIMTAAHPTVVLEKVECDKCRFFNDGTYRLEYTFYWHKLTNASKKHWTEFNFDFDKLGGLESISVGDHSNFLPPFSAVELTSAFMKTASNAGEKHQEIKALMAGASSVGEGEQALEDHLVEKHKTFERSPSDKALIALIQEGVSKPEDREFWIEALPSLTTALRRDLLNALRTDIAKAKRAQRTASK